MSSLLVIVLSLDLPPICISIYLEIKKLVEVQYYHPVVRLPHYKNPGSLIFSVRVLWINSNMLVEFHRYLRERDGRNI